MGPHLPPAWTPSGAPAPAQRCGGGVYRLSVSQRQNAGSRGGRFRPSTVLEPRRETRKNPTHDINRHLFAAPPPPLSPESSRTRGLRAIVQLLENRCARLGILVHPAVECL